MIGFKAFSSIPTNKPQSGLEINGPILAVSQQPVGITTKNNGIVNFVGVGTATFPEQSPANPALNNGTLTYKWHEVNVGPLSDTSEITGTGSTTLQLNTLVSPGDDGRQFFLRLDYVPSAYGVGKSTPNAINEPVDSETVTLTMQPYLIVDTEPGITTTAQGETATFTTNVSRSDGSTDDINYAWTQNGTTIAGANTNVLTLTDETVGVSTIQGVISSSAVSNSPIYTNIVDYEVVSARQIINYEEWDAHANIYGTGSTNLFDQTFTYTADSSVWMRGLGIYCPERDVDVRITMSAAAGQGRNGNSGGQGGSSVFELTLVQNLEYVFKLGSTTAPSGGSNGGGGGAFFYRGGNLLVTCGGGGGAGDNGRGGDGGGVAVAGANGNGTSAGSGGGVFPEGSLPVAGFFAGGAYDPPVNYSATTGGRVAACTIGKYWAEQGFSPCQYVGVTQYRGVDGETGSGTAAITRGYKPGLGHRNNGGNGSNNNGGGGAGCVGGDAGTSNGSGGGGASGYSNGEVTIITTQLGGNGGTNGTITIEKVD